MYLFFMKLSHLLNLGHIIPQFGALRIRCLLFVQCWIRCFCTILICNLEVSFVTLCHLLSLEQTCLMRGAWGYMEASFVEECIRIMGKKGRNCWWLFFVIEWSKQPLVVQCVHIFRDCQLVLHARVLYYWF